MKSNINIDIFRDNICELAYRMNGLGSRYQLLDKQLIEFVRSFDQ